MKQSTAGQQTQKMIPGLTSAIGVSLLLLGVLLVASFPTIAGVVAVSTAAVVAAALVGAAIERSRMRAAERHGSGSPRFRKAK